METDPRQDFWIGCVLVNQPVFFDEGDWVRMPEDWAANIVQGKGYDLSVGEGERVWLWRERGSGGRMPPHRPAGSRRYGSRTGRCRAGSDRRRSSCEC
jgi:hypothetical protein